MEQAIQNLHNRQIKQQEKLNFELIEVKRRHSILHAPRRVSILPPISNGGGNANLSFKKRRSRAQSLGGIKLTAGNESYGTAINAHQPIKLPNISQRRLSVKADDQHWNLPKRRVSKHDNDIIVEHLRTKLLKQHESRSLKHEEELKLLQEEEESVATIDSDDDEMMLWMQSVRSRGPSLSTMNFSSPAMSRQGHVSDQNENSAHSADTSRCHTPLSMDQFDGNPSISTKVDKENNATTSDGPRLSKLLPQRLSRPSICISSTIGESQWIDEEGRLNHVNILKTNCQNDLTRSQSSSQLNMSMKESERSVNLLIQRVRSRPVLTEILESRQENHNTNLGRLPTPSSANRLSPTLHGILKRKTEGQASFASQESQIQDKVYSSLPIGEVTLFSDWHSRAGSLDRLNSESLVSDANSLSESQTNKDLSRHNSFFSASRPATAHSEILHLSDTELGIITDPPETMSFCDTDTISDLNDCSESCVPRNEALRKICYGDVNVCTTKLRQKVSIYVSSSGIDTNLERSILDDSMMSQLRHFCNERKLSFEIIDLNSFPTEYKTFPLDSHPSFLYTDYNHSLIHLRSRLIRKCFSKSVGPCFMSFLGNTVGSSWSLPESIPKQVFNCIEKTMLAQVVEINKQIHQSNITLNKLIEGNRNISTRRQSVASIGFSVPAEAAEAEIQLSRLQENVQEVESGLILLRKWYQLDSNTKPPVYRLLNTSEEYETHAIFDVSNPTSSDIKRAISERKHWESTQERIRSVLTTYTSLKSNEETEDGNIVIQWRKKSLKTALEKETILASSAPSLRCSDSCFWFRRIILDCDSDDRESNHFMNKLRDENVIISNENLEDISKRLIEKFGHTNLREYSLPWKSVQLAYKSCEMNNANREWSMYIDRLKLDFYNVCTMQIDNDLSNSDSQHKDFLLEEIHQHQSFARNLSSNFIGRTEILNSIKSYLRSTKNRKPFVLYGAVGSGKSAIMSKAALIAEDWMKRKRKKNQTSGDIENEPLSCRTIFRSVAVTDDSRHSRLLLKGLCVQLFRILSCTKLSSDSENPSDKVSNTKPPERKQHGEKQQFTSLDFKNLAVKFSKLLAKCATDKTPLFIFLDNIDRVADGHDVKQFKWLPSKLPSNVKIVFSITSDAATQDNKRYNMRSPISRAQSMRRLSSSKSLSDRDSDVATFVPNCLETLKARYNLKDEPTKRGLNILRVPLLDEKSSSVCENTLNVSNNSNTTGVYEFVKALLKHQNRCLTEEQTQILINSVSLYPHPLAAIICIYLSQEWTSWQSMDKIKNRLPQNVSNIGGFVHSFFRFLEDRHGRALVVAVSCYVTLSFHGLTSSELLALLSRDKHIGTWLSQILLLKRGTTTVETTKSRPTESRRNAAKFSQTTGRPRRKPKAEDHTKKLSNSSFTQTVIKRVPDVLWQLLLADLDPFLSETLSDEKLTLQWTHGVFPQVCTIRYMSLNESKLYYHERLAAYFNNSDSACLAGRLDQCQRHDEDQPLFWKLKQTQQKENRPHHLHNSSTNTCSTSDSNLLSSKYVYNLRRLNEVPYHFAYCRTLDDIKETMLCNYEWLLAKICSSSYQDLIENFSTTLVRHSKDKDLRLLAETLYLSREIIKDDPFQLGSQLVGRLHSIIKRDKPLARLDPRKYPFCKKLMGQCRRSHIPVLIPSGTCLLSPGDILYDLHLGHTDVITVVTITSDGQRAITASRDETIKVWDLYSGQVTSTIEGMPRFVVCLTLCKGNSSVAIQDKYNKIEVLSLRTSSSLLCLSEPPGRVVTAAAGDGQCYLLVYSDNEKLIKVWDIEKARLIHKFDISPDEFELRSDQWLITAKNCRGNSVLFSFHSTDQAYIYNVKRAKQVQTLKLQQDVGAVLIVHVEVSREYYVIACTRQYMRLHEMVTFELYDAINYGHVRSIRGCSEDNVFALFINRLGSHLIALCRGEEGTDIGVWNVESGAHQHIAAQNVHATHGSCIDLQYCVTASEKETTLRMHNLAARIDERTMSKTQVKKSALGIGEFYPVASSSRYVVARGMDNGPITVWNITRGRCKGEAVSIERGLHEKNDVVVVKDVMVLILTDRGISTVGVGSQPVFNTILMYDLKTKRYTKKLHPVSVSICPRHEYRILGFDRLLAVSPDRSQFSVWSLLNGQILSNIAPDFSRYKLPKLKEEDIKEKKRHKKRRQAVKKKEKTRNETHLKVVSSFHLSPEECNKLIDEVLLSGDESTLLCSFYGRHVAVFDIKEERHVHTLTNEHSMLLLHQAKITHPGSHFVHTNYDDDTKLSYVSVWNLTQGRLLRRLRNEPLVCALDVSEDASRIVFATEDNYLKVWEPFKRGGHWKMAGYEGLRMRKRSNDCQGTTVYMTSSAERAILFTFDISLWDLEEGCVLSRFTPDIPFQCCTVAMNGNLIIAGMKDTANVVTLRLLSREKDVNHFGRAALGTEIGDFGEKEEKDSESSEDEVLKDEL